MSASPVISYLHYLQEVSRKILLRSGYENVLYGKSKKQNPCYFNYDRKIRLPEYLLQLKALLQRDQTRGLYLGLGLFVGQVERNKGNRKIAAPLFVCSVDVFSEEGSPVAMHEIRWESITLNYDLITMVLERRMKLEDEEASLSLPEIDQLISPQKLKILSDVEAEFDRRGEAKDFQRELLKGDRLESTVKLIMREIPEFNCVTISDEDFDSDNLNDLIRNDQSLLNLGATLTFFPHSFLFTAPVPEQLATYIGLRELISQIEH